MKRSGAKNQGESASQAISQRIAELGDWRGETLARVRALIHEADPEIVEEWKWMGTPVFSHDGIVCTGESYKSVVKLTFAQGAFLKDPARLFNSSLEGNQRRAIDIHQGEKIDVRALKALIADAVALNVGTKAKKASLASSGKAVPKAAGRSTGAQGAKKTAAKKMPAKKMPAKKMPAKKMPAKKMPAKKTAAKKTAAKRPARVQRAAR